MSFSGHCLCGAVSYTSDADPVTTVVCHCDDCQRQSGAAFSVNVLVMGDALAIEGEDALRSYETIGDESGAPRYRKFCATCGSPILTELTDMEGMVAIKAGTLDDRSWLEPEMAVWCDRKHPWLTNDVELGEFPTGLPT